MRIAVISDIHGNLTALRAAISDIDERRVDKTVCLGDVAATGPEPAEVVQFLRNLTCQYVMGNADETLAKGSPRKFAAKMKRVLPEEDRKNLEALDLWTRKQLTRADTHFMSMFKPTIGINLRYETKLLCFHGSPISNNDMILSRTPDEKLANMLKSKDRIYAGGHTHIQMLRSFSNSIIMNPGSVGLAFRREPSGRRHYHCTVAEYALVNLSRGRLSIEFVSVPYSLSELSSAVRKSGMPNPDWWLSDWL